MAKSKSVKRPRPDFEGPAKVVTITAAASELLRSLKNMRAWMEKNRDRMPPISLQGMDKAIEKAEEAGIK